MTEFIGQKNLLSVIDSYTLSTLPKTLLLIGPAGCGKKTVTNYIKDKFGFELEVIDENITQDQLIEFSRRTIPTIYRIDLINFNEKSQNQFLKFIEEPSDSVFVVLTAYSEIGVLQTVLNRCTKLTFEPYSISELQQFFTATDPVMYDICKTPGSLVNMSQKLFDSLIGVCKGLCEYSSSMSLPRILAISAEVNCKDNYDKFDFDMFFDAMAFTSYKRFKELNDELSFKIYLTTVELKKKRINKNIVKDSFLINYLNRLFEVTH